MAYLWMESRRRVRFYNSTDGKTVIVEVFKEYADGTRRSLVTAQVREGEIGDSAMRALRADNLRRLRGGR